MSRPKRERKVEFHPIIRGFKPLGVPFKNEEYISVLYEEFEALRLSDYEYLSHEEAAKKMNISRPTFTRIYDNVRKKVARSFVEGRTIIIEGGDVHFDKEWFRCRDCHHVFHSNESNSEQCVNCKSKEIEHINENIIKWRNNKAELDDQYLGVEKYCLCIDCYFKKNGNEKERCTVDTCPKQPKKK